MNSSDIYEKGRIRYRFRELATLAGFTFGAALVSLIVMDITVFPVTLFAINFTEAFNSIIVYGLYTALFLAILYPLAKKIILLKQNSVSFAGILAYLLKRIAYYSVIFIIFLAITVVLIAALYLLLYHNHFMLQHVPGIN